MRIHYKLHSPFLERGTLYIQKIIRIHHNHQYNQIKILSLLYIRNVSLAPQLTVEVSCGYVPICALLEQELYAAVKWMRLGSPPEGLVTRLEGLVRYPRMISTYVCPCRQC